MLSRRPKAKIELSAPDWDALLGEADEAGWIADRDRKFSNAATIAVSIRRVFETLGARDELFTASIEGLLCDPFAATWYVSLAGFAQKTLSNVVDGPKRFGMQVRPNTLVTKLAAGKISAESLGRASSGQERKDLDAFARWVTDEIGMKFPVTHRDPQVALLHVALVLGGRVIGMGQNEGGDDAVVLVKSLLVRGLANYGPVAVRLNGSGNWEPLDPEHNLTKAPYLRFGRDMICEFVSGGNRPDIKVYSADEVIAVGEIKGRKDLANVWESWMPQVVGHMKTWAAEFPNTVRLFFGTLINSSMVNGVSRMGTKHTGFRELFETGQLSGAYNISKVIARDSKAESSFNELVASLAQFIR